jgi:GNAT superfamily N-acetyltransferase
LHLIGGAVHLKCRSQNPTMPLSLRRLRLDDFPACLDLAVNRGWLPEVARWKILLACGEGWALDDAAGGLAAVVVLTRFPPNVAFIGMMLVREDRSRQGLGRQLMEHVLRQAEPDTVLLYATEMGQPLYERLGFRQVDAVARHLGNWKAADLATPDSRTMAAGDLSAVIALDREVLGADRRDLLNAIFCNAARARVVDRNGHIEAFGIVWQNGERMQVGPLVAPDAESARTLIDDLARDHELPVRIDVAVTQVELIHWLQSRGLVSNRITPLMVLGGKDVPGDRSRLIAVATLATG